MEIKKIHELIKILEKSPGISEVSVEEKGFKFHIKFNTESSGGAQSVIVHQNTIDKFAPAPSDHGSAAKKTQQKHILSPIVGTFYSKPSPDTAAYVKVGDKVTAKSIVCIIESMKVFNEIEAEIEGTIKQLLVKDGSPVEHGQPLFVVE